MKTASHFVLHFVATLCRKLCRSPLCTLHFEISNLQFLIP